MIQVADLKTVPFFQELSEDELKKLTEVMEEKSFKKGEIIFNEGEEGKALYLLVEGEVEVVKTMKGWYQETLAVFKKGRLFGELSFLSGRNHSALARATQDVKVFVLTKNQYDRLEKNDPVITQKIMKVIALTLSTALQKMNERFLHMVNYILGEESGA
ncbi:MAG TPA: cyclic nucleotide-binding domain-containing protein [Nitrospiria bacterium]|nr:cyclic nucleotide-binding domain-containing protein [Nitrospiria bacterium]